MLHEFLTSNRQILIDRCSTKIAPIFLDQLINTLIVEERSPAAELAPPDQPMPEADAVLTASAALHGRELHERGFTLEHVVRDHGDICQVVTQLALQTNAPIAVAEFRTLNRCLDNAIAAAVTEYARQSAVRREDATDALNIRLGPLAHELRNHLHTATLVVAAMKMGNVGIASATGAVLDRCLLSMQSLVDRALSEVRVTARMPPRRQSIHLATFLATVRTAASFDALARGTPFTVYPVGNDIMVYADPEMLAASVGNLLQNAFKFTQHRTEVTLRTSVSGERVLIDVEDRCGGLSDGAVEKMFLPFAQSSRDRSGLGLGLDISRRGVEANDGVLRVRDVPGIGCIFTIDLPLQRPE